MAQPLTVTIPHQLGRDEARRRIETGLSRFVGQVGGMARNYQQAWSGDRMDFSAEVMGQPLSGAIHVLDDAARVELVLPGLLGLMAGKIKGKLQREGQLLLEKR
ncbi:MAG TPA: polyhydroxyalkanoic acid system family protein [Caulobacteraceae bacterium]|nr:polyhydroxyalkanoic acid system family protein [Caulobacteraceae bacterium]